MNTENTQTAPDYLHRNISASFSLFMFDSPKIDIDVKRKIEVDNNGDINQAIVDVIQGAGSDFLSACRNLILPANPLPGDQPMVQLSLEYFHYLESPDENLSFSCVEIAVIEPGELNQAIVEVSNQAKALFARRLPALLNA